MADNSDPLVIKSEGVDELVMEDSQKSAVAEMPEDKEQYLLDRGWTKEPDVQWYDNSPPAPKQVKIAEQRGRGILGGKRDVYQTYGSSVPWKYPLDMAVAIERKRNREAF